MKFTRELRYGYRRWKRRRRTDLKKHRTEGHHSGAEANPSNRAPRLNHLPKLYFLHIPKTAGTTFRDWLQPFFREQEQLRAEHLIDLEGLDPNQLSNFRFASGHFGWRLMEMSDRGQSFFEAITVLRDPIELALSGMRYIDKVPTEDLSRLPSSTVKTVKRLADLAQAGIFPAGIADASHIDPALIAEAERYAQPYRNMMVRFLSEAGTEQVDLQPLTRHSLDLATLRLKRMRFFALVEDLRWSAALFADAYKLPLRPIGSRLNVTWQQSDGDIQVDRQWLRQSNCLDVSLYQFARRLFDSRVRDLKLKYGLTDDARPDDLRVPLLKSFLDTEHGLHRIDSAEIDMSDGLICEGFHPRFFHEPWGRWIRWSGPGLVSTIFLPLETSAARHLRVEIAAALSEDIRDNLSIEVNGNAVEVQRSYELLADGSYFTVCEVAIPRSVMQHGGRYTAIAFIAPAILMMREDPNVDVEIPVSFALGRISVQ